MRMTSLVLTATVCALSVGIANAQTTASAKILVGGGSATAPASATGSVSQASLTLDIHDASVWHSGGYSFVPVGVLWSYNGGTTNKLGLVNTFVDLRNSQLGIHDPNSNQKFVQATSPRGNTAIAAAGHNLRDNSSSPSLGGNGIKGAADKALFIAPTYIVSEGVAYTFYVKVPKQRGDYPIEFGRVGSTNGTELRTTFGTQLNANLAPEVSNAMITVVPEPASLAALSAGLLGLLKRRKRA